MFQKGSKGMFSSLWTPHETLRNGERTWPWKWKPSSRILPFPKLKFLHLHARWFAYFDEKRIDDPRKTICSMEINWCERKFAAAKPTFFDDAEKKTWAIYIVVCITALCINSISISIDADSFVVVAPWIVPVHCLVQHSVHGPKINTNWYVKRIEIADEFLV